MTTVVAVLDRDGRPYMASDSAWSVGGVVVGSAQPKIWRLGPLLIGSAGPAAHFDLLRELEVPQWAEQDPLKWLRRELPSLARRYRECEVETQAFLVAWTDYLVWVDGNLGLVVLAQPGLPGQRYAALGSGHAVALGALALACHMDLSLTASTLRHVMAVAAKHDSLTDSRVTFLSLDSTMTPVEASA